MESLSIINVAAFGVFTVFMYAQQVAGQRFKGANQSYGVALNASAALWMIAGIAFLLWFGFTRSWLGAAALFGTGFLARAALAIPVGMFSPPLAAVAFLACPVLLYLAATA